jgi:hypothetical protein
MSVVRGALFRTDDQGLAFQRLRQPRSETPTSVIEPPLSLRARNDKQGITKVGAA